MADSDTEPDLDPVKASYDVYIKPHISEERQIYILQFPNRDAKQNYCKLNETTPLKMRVKEKAGMVELDVPVDVWSNYDRDKGIRWGEAIRKSDSSKGGGSHGLPGGFGIGGAAHSGRGRGKASDEDDVNVQMAQKDWGAAVGRGQVLQKQTLGGQFVSTEDTTPRYLIGIFRKGAGYKADIDFAWGIPN